jgi:HEAT repeat protein
VRIEAVRTLGRTRDVSAIPALIAALGDDVVSAQTACALVRIGVPAVPALINEINDNSSLLRLKAVKTLGKIRHISAVPALITALQDDAIRACVADALVQIGIPAVPALINEVTDKCSPVRIEAIKTLDRMRDVSAVHGFITALEDELIAARSAGAIVRIGSPAVEALISAVSDTHTEVRLWAANCLGLIGDITAVPALIKAVGDETSQVRTKAVKALKRLGYVAK